MTRLILFALAISGLLVSGGAQAQPETKLASALDAKARHILWCSAVFYEEALWYDEDDAWSTYYAALGDNLGWRSDTALRDTALSAAEHDELWRIYDAGAAALAENDEDAFFGAIAVCEADFSTLAPRPQD